MSGLIVSMMGKDVPVELELGQVRRTGLISFEVAESTASLVRVG